MSEQDKGKGKLKAKIDEFKQSGKIEVGSKDVGDFALPETPEATDGSVTVAPADEAVNDPMINTGSKGNNGEQLAAEVAGDATVLVDDMTDSVGYTALDEGPIELSEKERELFIDAMIADDRFVLPFSAYGGKLKGKLRSRTQAESKAILSRLSWEMNEGILVTNLDYTTRMRNMLLTAQIQELQDEMYTELKGPMLRTIDGKDTTEPGWLDQVDLWANKGNEALTAALYEQIRIFERKYWTMVSSSRDQNFWDPAESTSG